MWTVTLEQLRAHEACVVGYNKVVCMLSGQEPDSGCLEYMQFDHDEPISLIDIANHNGVDDALWATKCMQFVHVRDLRQYAIWCARQWCHLMQDDEVIATSLDVFEHDANGSKPATEQEISAARETILNWMTGTAITDAKLWHARLAAKVATAPNAGYAAWAAARMSLKVGEWDASSDTQMEMFIKMCNGEAPWQVEKGIPCGL